MPKCPWCSHPSPEDYDEALLCRPHYAEFLGLTLAGLERMEDEERGEYADTIG